MLKIKIVLLVTACCLICPTFTATTGVSTAASSTVKPEGFSARAYEVDNEDDEFDSQAQTHIAYRRQPVYDYSQSEEVDQEEAPRQVYQNHNVQQQQSNYLRGKQKQRPISEEETEEVEEEEEPDRLSTLLAKSTFNCNSKNSGYYADESLNCEVFHYCQDNQRHSWICPEGFTFHQIHLICMPPSHDNICQQSSKYHIVNDYLYKPINLQEHQTKPNVTLRYSNRYFPANYYDRTDDYDEEEEVPRQRVSPQRQPIQVGFRSQQVQPQTHPTPTTISYSAQPQAQALYQQQTRQPIQQQVRHQPTQAPQVTAVYRRPAPAPTTTTTTTAAPVTAQRTVTYAPFISPAPYRFFTAAPQLNQQLAQQQVYRSPEEINISLQQRRPQYFVATQPPRYYDDDYLYERKK